ncbi:MAG TPA: methyltransferase [Thermoanaerobaculia bacterium]|nr:methyltransferase [Thermoanaerobaculia bacterium]
MTRAEVSASSRQLIALYDALSRFNLLANLVRFGHPRADLTLHKALRIPAEQANAYGKSERRLYVVDRALAAVTLPPAPRVLDAGCGFGGTVFRWQERIGGTYDGLTVSRVQWRVARREAVRRGLAAACRFHLRSYDAPIEDDYDAVVAIEAVIHSPDFERTLANLVSALRPGGKLVLVEDVPRDEAVDDPDFAIVRECWALGRVPTASTYARALAGDGLRTLHDEDLSALVPTRPPAELAAAEARYRRAHALLPFPAARRVLAAYLGGVAFERLYHRGMVSYRLIVAERAG